jgi:hypothetical protein
MPTSILRFKAGGAGLLRIVVSIFDPGKMAAFFPG